MGYEQVYQIRMSDLICSVFRILLYKHFLKSLTGHKKQLKIEHQNLALDLCFHSLPIHYSVGVGE